MWEKRSATFRYTVFGALFGLLFPVFSTLLDVYLHRMPWTVASLLAVQKQLPLHWIIDTAPLFLGLFASIAGRRQDRLLQLSVRLQQFLHERDRAVQQFRTLQMSLEKDLAARTGELEQRARQLATASEVGRMVTSILEPETLAQQTVNLLRDRFNLYYAGLFLLDAASEYAVLAAGTGEAGREMVKRGHRLEVGGSSMVGAVCAEGVARIALDVGAEPVRFANPLLPETRSEMALPLAIGERVLGALDVQSTEPAAFHEDDIRVMQLVANQVAVAVDNAAKFSSEAMLLEAGSPLFRASSRLAAAVTLDDVIGAIAISVAETEADGCAIARFGFAADREIESMTFIGHWQRSARGQLPLGQPFPAASAPLPLALITEPWTSEDLPGDDRVPVESRVHLAPYGIRAMANMPVEAGGQVAGFMFVYRNTPGSFSGVALRLYQTLANQAGVALERARLVEESQRRAAHEQLIGQIAARMRETLDVETVLKTALVEMGMALGIPRIEVRMAGELPGNGSGSVYKGEGDGIMD